MRSSFRAWTPAVLAVVLAACGGGGSAGSGSGGIGTGTSQVAITEANAKPVAANALDATQNTSATSGATGPVGVQVDASAGGGTPTLQAMVEAARLAANSLSASVLPAGVAINQTAACDFGGSATISGNVANSTGLSTGDSIAVSMSNCGVSVGGTTAVMNGSMTMTIAGGSLPVSASAFHVVIAVTANNLSVATGGVTVTSSGDTRLDWTAISATSQTLSASGTAMSSQTTVSGATHATTIRNFNQSVTISGSTYTGTLSATVETNSSRIATGSVTYTITTPTPVVWNASTRAATAGVIKVVGASGSQILVTIAAGGGVTIQLDANGDGTYEKTITSTTAELAGLV